MKSVDWINRLMKEKELPSYRQAALLMGMTEQLMSHHKTGKCVTLDDKYAYKMEELLGLPHGKIVADQHAEREKDPNISAMWRRLASGAAVFLLTFCQLTFHSNPAESKELIYSKINDLRYIYISNAKCANAPRMQVDAQLK